MSKAAWKIFRRMKRTQAGWHSHDFETLYTGFGFRMIHEKKHDIYRHPDFPQLEDQIPRHPEELAKVYARTAVKNIDALLRLTGETDQNDE
jgi:hypothetical protein